MRTALILYEGDYSGVIEPDRHYFSLKKDYSNFDDAVSFIRDPASVYATTERAFSDIVASGRYGYKSLAAAFDSAVENLASSRIGHSTTEQWPLTSAYADDSLRFILLDGEIGDSGRAVAKARAGLPSGELLHTDTRFVTLRQRDSFLGALRLRQSVTSGEYIARLPPCRISDLQLGLNAPGPTPVNGRVVLLFCGRQTYSQAITPEPGAPATIAEPVLADEIRVAFERSTMALAPSVRGKVRRITGVHSLIPPERATSRAAKRLWHTLPLSLRLSPWGMRAKAVARAVRARWRPLPDAEKMEPLLRRR